AERESRQHRANRHHPLRRAAPRASERHLPDGRLPAGAAGADDSGVQGRWSNVQRLTSSALRLTLDPRHWTRDVVEDLLARQAYQVAQGVFVAAPAEALDGAAGDGRDERMLSPLVAGVDVAEVDLDKGIVDGLDRVMEADAGVGQSRWIDDAASQA